MDNIEKALSKLKYNERKKVKEILIKIKKEEFENFDIKKLKGRRDVFRVRKGRIRIIFYKTEDFVKILAIEKRSDRTY